MTDPWQAARDALNASAVGIDASKLTVEEVADAFSRSMTDAQVADIVARLEESIAKSQHDRDFLSGVVNILAQAAPIVVRLLV